MLDWAPSNPSLFCHLLQAITVADARFPFRALEEHSSCDLLRVPASGDGAQLLGAVRQKLVVQRNVEEERSRVRARGEEAERRGHERTAKLLSSAKAHQASKPGRPPAATSVQRRVTPPPSSGRGPTPPPQLTASMLAAPTGRPPAHPSAPTQPLPAAAAAPAPAAAKPVHKSASTGKLGLTSKGGAGSALPQSASPRVLQAARAGVGLRLLLIAILAERPMAQGAVKAGEVGSRAGTGGRPVRVREYGAWAGLRKHSGPFGSTGCCLQSSRIRDLPVVATVVSVYVSSTLRAFDLPPLTA